jgi:hypothetical protein
VKKMLDIKTNFMPYAMTLSRREPVELFVEIKNKGEEACALTLQIYTTHRLALDSGGLKNIQQTRVENFKPNEKKNWYFKLFPKVTTEIGENPVEVKIAEHHGNDFTLIKRRYNLGLTLLARR